MGVLGTGKSDPYVILSVGAQQRKSKIINNSVNPKWEFYCEVNSLAILGPLQTYSKINIVLSYY